MITKIRIVQTGVSFVGEEPPETLDQVRLGIRLRRLELEQDDGPTIVLDGHENLAAVSFRADEHSVSVPIMEIAVFAPIEVAYETADGRSLGADPYEPPTVGTPVSTFDAQTARARKAI